VRHTAARGGFRLDDILSRAFILRALVALRENEPTPLSKGQLMLATSRDSRGMDRLLADLLEWNLITITETTRGKLPVNEHRLTPLGREVADLALKLEAKAKRARGDP
jgi:hypothetical protein